MSADIFYYIVMSFDNPALQYILLASIVAPHIVNLVRLVREHGPKGVLMTIVLGLGAHELAVAKDGDNYAFDQARSINVICEDVP